MKDWTSRAVSADDAVRLLKSGMRVFLHGACATPTPLVEALARRTDLEGVRLYHLHTAGPAPFADEGCGGKRFCSVSLFTGAPLRKPIEEGRADFMPVFLSDIPGLFISRDIPLDAALLQLSPPDRHGNCTLGTSVDTAKAAADTAPIIIAEINEQMPRTHGNSVVPFEKVTAFIHTDRPLHEQPQGEETAIEAKIGQLIADLVEDGSTLQMGIGGIPDAALSRLKNKHDLGVHTEMFSDRIIDLIEAGVVTNKFKQVHPGRTVTSFINGSRRLFDFVHDNLAVEFHPCDRTNDTAVIRRNPRVVAINSAIQVDLTGQVCADSIGSKFFSGFGGQVDFNRGAARSPGGKAIIALPSTAREGKVSRIVTRLSPGAGVVTTRAHARTVVTEWGVAELHGKSIRERAQALIAISHPDFRDELTVQARKTHYL